MKVPIEAHNSPTIYQFPPQAGVEMRTYANAHFMTYNGQVIPAGSPNNENDWYLPVPCEIQGGNILYVPGHEIDSTEDSPTNRAATYTSWLFANGERLGNIPYLAGYGVPALRDPLTEIAIVQTWPSLILHRNARNPPPRQGVYDIGQVEYLITQALGVLNMASDLNSGNTKVTVPPIDPGSPVAVGANDPLWLALQAGVGLSVGSGTADMVDGRVTVLTALALAASKIFLGSMDLNVSGALHVENVVPGVSFDIVSNNFGDNGVVSWMLTG